jgi:hypothetical protein
VCELIGVGVCIVILVVYLRFLTLNPVIRDNNPGGKVRLL